MSSRIEQIIEEIEEYIDRDLHRISEVTATPCKRKVPT